MSINAPGIRCGLAVVAPCLLTLGIAWPALAAPPEGGDPPAEAGTAPAPETEDDTEDDDWGADEDPDDDWGEDDEDDDWDGQVLIEDVSNDPAAAAEEKVEQVEVEGDKGSISGVVKDTTNGDPLMGANVRALKTPYEVTTDAEGRYTLELPPGEYTLEFFYETFSVKEVSNLSVAKDGTRTQNVELTPMAGMVLEQEIVAEAPKANTAVQLTDRKESKQTKDVMSQEEMKKSGGGDVGKLARLIVGATLDQGRFLIVRGLTHRYGNTLFDGARVSSPNPELRTVPLDIFPSGALSAITIVKTFTPDTPADFTGGSTQLESRDIPDELTFNLSASVKANTVVTGQDYLVDQRFAADRFAYGNIPRGYAPGFPTKNQVGGTVEIDGQSVARYSADEIEAFGESVFMRTPINEISRGAGYSVNATLGDGMYLGRGTRFGWVASAGIANNPSARRGASAVYACTSRSGGPTGMGSTCPDDFVLTPRTDYGVNTGLANDFVDNNQINGLGLFKFNVRDKTEVFGNVMYSRDADSQVRYLEGVSPSSVGPQTIVSTRHRYVMRSILFTQLGAKHEIDAAKGLMVDYFAAFSQARRDDPGVREILYVENDSNPGEFQAGVAFQAPDYQSLDLVDDIGNGALNFEMPFKQWKQLDSSFKIGGWIEGKEREFVSRRFNFPVATGLGGSVPTGIGNIVRPETLGGGVSANSGGQQPFFLRETTQPVDNYFGNQRIFAGYAMMSLPIVRWFEVSGGARFEHSRIEVGAFNFFDRDADVIGTTPAELENNDVFPSLSLIFKPTDRQNVRLSGTQTVARPEFRELAPFSFTDMVGGTQTVGNPFLTQTTIWNADLRWEFFPTGEEVVAASAFFKHFDEPIERGLSAGSSTNIATFLNSRDGFNAGGELELKKNLGFLGRRSKKNGGGMKEKARWLEDLSVGANFAYIYSRVRRAVAINSETGEVLPAGTELDACPDGDEKCRRVLQFSAATSDVRPLQGQSPWIANGFIDYDNSEVGFNGRVIYNAFGPRIRQLGGLGQSDEYQLTVHNLDLVFSQRLMRVQSSTDSFEASTSNELRLTFQVGNVLNWNMEWGQFDARDRFYTTQQYRDGTSFSLGISYQY